MILKCFKLIFRNADRMGALSKNKERSPFRRPLGTLENYSTSVRSENTKGTLRHI